MTDKAIKIGEGIYTYKGVRIAKGKGGFSYTYQNQTAHRIYPTTLARAMESIDKDLANGWTVQTGWLVYKGGN